MFWMNVCYLFHDQTSMIMEFYYYLFELYFYHNVYLLHNFIMLFDGYETCCSINHNIALNTNVWGKVSKFLLYHHRRIQEYKKYRINPQFSGKIPGFYFPNIYRNLVNRWRHYRRLNRRLLPIYQLELKPRN